MLIFINVKTKMLVTKDVTIDCPECLQRGIGAVAFDQDRIESIFNVLPVSKTIRSGVICAGCNHQFFLNDKADILASLSREELWELLTSTDAITFVTKLLIALSFVLFCFPVVPLVMALIGLERTYTTRSGWRTAALIAVILTGIVTSVSLGITVFNALLSGAHVFPR